MHAFILWMHVHALYFSPSSARGSRVCGAHVAKITWVLPRGTFQLAAFVADSHPAAAERRASSS